MKRIKVIYRSCLIVTLVFIFCIVSGISPSSCLSEDAHQDEDNMIPEPAMDDGEVYQKYLSTYNKWNKLTASVRKDTPEAQAAYKAYEEAKEEWEAVSKEAYQEYISAYNKLNYLIKRHEGDTPKAKEAYEDYKEKKDRWEAIEKAEDIVTDSSSNITREEKPSSMQEAYDRYIAAYNHLIKMVTETRVTAPPEMKEVSDRYHEYLEKYNRTKDGKDYQAYIAAYNRLTSRATKVTFTSPESLKRAQEDYFNAKAEYDRWVKESR